MRAKTGGKDIAYMKYANFQRTISILYSRRVIRLPIHFHPLSFSTLFHRFPHQLSDSGLRAFLRMMSSQIYSLRPVGRFHLEHRGNRLHLTRNTVHLILKIDFEAYTHRLNHFWKTIKY